MDEFGIEFEITAKPTQENIRVLEAGLETFNRAAATSSERNKVPLAVWMRRDGHVLGGAYGDTHYGWLYLSLLWVDESLRGEGWGSRLVTQFEAEGTARGCHGCWVDTYGFQAPGFYEKLGYREFGRLDDFPIGSARLFYWRPLRER